MRDPVFFARIEQGRPILIPAEGYAALSLVHVNDVARLMTALVGNEKVKGEAYNVSGSEITSVQGVMRLIGEAMGKKVEVVEVPMELARRQRPPLIHWGEGTHGTAVLSIDKALRDIDWTPRFGIVDGYRDSYAWWEREGRDRYQFDFSGD